MKTYLKCLAFILIAVLVLVIAFAGIYWAVAHPQYNTQISIGIMLFCIFASAYVLKLFLEALG